MGANIDLEREYHSDDILANELKWAEEELFYEQQRNKRLPAIIKVMIPLKHLKLTK